MYEEKFAVVKFKGKMKKIFAKDDEQMRNVTYLHYIFGRNGDDILPESIVQKRDEDDENFDEYSERG